MSSNLIQNISLMYLDFFFYFIFLTSSSLGFSSLALENDWYFNFGGLKYSHYLINPKNSTFECSFVFLDVCSSIVFITFTLKNLINHARWPLVFFSIDKDASIYESVPVILHRVLNLDSWVLLIKVIFKWILFINSIYLR